MISSRSALFVGHPGHELRLHHWLEVERPVVFILTNGAGRGTIGRAEESRALIDRCGATPGSIFAPFTDMEVYDLLLRGDVAPLADVVRALAEELRLRQTELVAGDTWELYNPVHDLARVMLNLAVDMAGARTGRAVANYEVGSPGVRTLTLDDEALARKVAAANAYVPLRAEVEQVIASDGLEGLRVESLRPATPVHPPRAAVGYEQHGIDRVAARHYRTVIRYEEHFAPFVGQLAGALQPALV